MVLALVQTGKGTRSMVKCHSKLLGREESRIEFRCIYTELPTLFNHQAQLESYLRAKHPNLIPKLEEKYQNQTLDYITGKNLLRVSIFYDQIKETTIADSPAYSVYQFIADMGKYPI